MEQSFKKNIFQFQDWLKENLIGTNITKSINFSYCEDKKITILHRTHAVNSCEHEDFVKQMNIWLQLRTLTPALVPRIYGTITNGEIMEKTIDPTTHFIFFERCFPFRLWVDELKERASANGFSEDDVQDSLDYIGACFWQSLVTYVLATNHIPTEFARPSKFVIGYSGGVPRLYYTGKWEHTDPSSMEFGKIQKKIINLFVRMTQYFFGVLPPQGHEIFELYKYFYAPIEK